MGVLQHDYLRLLSVSLFIMQSTSCVLYRLDLFVVGKTLWRFSIVLIINNSSSLSGRRFVFACYQLIACFLEFLSCTNGRAQGSRIRILRVFFQENAFLYFFDWPVRIRLAKRLVLNPSK